MNNDGIPIMREILASAEIPGVTVVVGAFVALCVIAAVAVVVA